MNNYSFPQSVVISEAAKNLISQILVTDASKRPSLTQILKHDFFNQGTSIPKLLPVLTLTCAPSLSYIRTFIPNAGENGIINKPLAKKLVSGEGKKDQNLKGPDIWVKKYFDYSHKIGLGYLLSNGLFGVIFKDNSKIIFNPETKIFFFIEKRSFDKKEIIVKHKIDDYPKELEKKVKILEMFKSYLESFNDNKNEKDKQNINNKNEEKEIEERPYIYIKKYTKTIRVRMFILSNKIVQFRFRGDHTEIIIMGENMSFTYVNKKGERSTYPLCKALENFDDEMSERLKYAKGVLTHLYNLNFQKKSENQSETDISKTQGEK